MKYRRLGRTGLEVSEVGFGAWGIGGITAGATSYGAADDEVSSDALRHALDRGVTFYDTSNVYGYGHSEALIGEAFKGRRERVVIATKAGRIDYDREDYSGPQLRRSLEGSLKRLQTDHVDVLQLHSPPISVLQEDGDIAPTLARLLEEGKLRAYGISVRSPADGIAAIRDFGFSVVQINLNLLDQRAMDTGLLALAAERGVGIVARTPLSFGFLSGRVGPDTRFDPSDHRSAWPREQIERWVEGSEAFMTALAREGQTRAQLAIRFCLSHPTVSTTIPGMMKRAEVEENAAASDLGPLQAAELAEVSRIYSSMTFFVSR